MSYLSPLVCFLWLRSWISVLDSAAYPDHSWKWMASIWWCAQRTGEGSEKSNVFNLIIGRTLRGLFNLFNQFFRNILLSQALFPLSLWQDDIAQPRALATKENIGFLARNENYQLSIAIVAAAWYVDMLKFLIEVAKYCSSISQQPEDLRGRNLRNSARWNKCLNVDGESIKKRIYFISLHLHSFHASSALLPFHLNSPRICLIDSMLIWCSPFVFHVITRTV